MKNIDPFIRPAYVVVEDGRFLAVFITLAQPFTRIGRSNDVIAAYFTRQLSNVPASLRSGSVHLQLELVSTFTGMRTCDSKA